MTSIRRRLLIGLAVALTCAWLLLAAVVYLVAQYEIEEVFDAHLAQYARILQSLAQAGSAPHEGLSGGLTISPHDSGAAGHHYERKLLFALWDVDAALIVRSPQAPEDLAAPRVSGYDEIDFADHHWRTFSLVEGGGGVRVWVAERDDVRGELVTAIILEQLAPGFLMLPLMMILVYVVVGRGLAPLQRVAGEVARRRPDQLEPIELAAPREVAPLTQALNRLFAQVQAAFVRERRFTADAAHELRTPLAAIKTQAEVALGEQDPAARTRALRNIVRGADRATRVGEQLLMLARLDAGERYPLAPQRVDLTALARGVLVELAPLALERGIDLSLEGDAVCLLEGNGDLLSVLARNLIDNAIRYSPDRGKVVVTVDSAGECPQLTVDDNGPGIPDNQRARVFERFYRGSGGSGSGLGLSIARRIVELYGGELEVARSPLGGARFSVCLSPRARGQQQHEPADLLGRPARE